MNCMDISLQNFPQNSHEVYLPIESSVGFFVILSNFTNKSLKGHFADQKLSRLLVTTYFTKSHSTGTISMGFLNSSRGWGRFSRKTPRLPIRGSPYGGPRPFGGGWGPRPWRARGLCGSAGGGALNSHLQKTKEEKFLNIFFCYFHHVHILIWVLR